MKGWEKSSVGQVSTICRQFNLIVSDGAQGYEKGWIEADTRRIVGAF